MALVRSFVCVLFCFWECSSFLRDPFPSGFSMADMGTILWQNGIRGRQPWTPAAFMNDSLIIGFACQYTSFYAQMDNFIDRNIHRVSGGFWFGGRKIKVKSAISVFDALSIYFEQTGIVSIGTDVIPFIRLSGDLTGTRSGLYGGTGITETLAEIGFSILIPFKRVTITSTVDHIAFRKNPRTMVTTDLTVRSGVHTVANKFGAQGFLLEVIPKQEHPIRMFFGEEIYLLHWLSLRASISTNPCFVGIGINVEWKNGSADISFVNNPDLGWSKGFGAGYGIKAKR